MALPKEIYIAEVVALVRTLSDAQVQQLATLLTNEDIKLSVGSLTVQHIAQIPMAVAESLVTLFRHWQRAGATSTELAIALLAARSSYAQTIAVAPSVQLVWTGPINAPAPMRSTISILCDMISTARVEIVIVGYVLTAGASVVFEHLSTAQKRGVRVVIIGNRLEEQLPVFQLLWPSGQRLPYLYTYQQTSDDPLSALHAKLAIADQKTMLVTSANLTYHGLVGNIEIGLQVTGKVITECIDLLNRLIDKGILIMLNTGT